MKLRVVHVVAGLWKDTGGPAEVIPNLCRAQAAAGAHVTLCSLEGDVAPQVRDLEGSGVHVRLFPTKENTIRYAPEMRRYLESLGTVDIIHNHGHWLWPNWCASAMSQRLNAGLVTTPHGTLVPGMLAQSSLKKRLAWHLYDRRLMARADIIHALSPAERDAMVPKLGPKHAQKMRVVANGVALGQDAGKFTADETGTLLFLSRVAPIKGITQLLAAWEQLAPQFPGWRLKIVGPIDASIASEVAKLTRNAQRVEMVGPIYSDERWAHYRSAAAFILPTLGEGLPTVLLEAAAHRLPVITTAEANFDSLREAGGSILTSPRPDAIEATLSDFFMRTGSERRAIGERGAAMIKAEYEWRTVASQWLSLYSGIRDQKRGKSL